MKRLTVNLDDENYNYLKNQDRTMTLALNDLISAVREAGIQIKPTIVSASIINTQVLPEGATIRATKATPKPQKIMTPYERLQARATEVLGHRLLRDDWLIKDYNDNHTYYDKKYEKPLYEGSVIKCVCIYDLPEDRQEQYIQELKEYELTNPFNPDDYDPEDFEPVDYAPKDNK